MATNQDNGKPKESEQVIREQIASGLISFRKTNVKLFLSAFTAGLEIGFSILLMGFLYTSFSPHHGEEVLHFIVSFGYPLGFIFVIIGRSQLFTEQTTLAVIPFLNGRVGFGQLMRLWGIVFIANILGGFLFALLITWFGPRREIISVEAFSYFADSLTSPAWYTILGSAVLAGWLMGLLSWLTTVSQESISRILVVTLITLVIGFGKLHHCIVGSIELFAGMLAEHNADMAEYGLTMLFSVIGNIVGGAFFVAVLKYSTVKV